jgi:hypothetical protein
VSPASADMTSAKQAWCKRPVGKDHDAAERWLSLALVEIARLTAQRRLNLALAAVEQVLKLVRSELDDLRADHKLIRCELEEILLSVRRASPKAGT